MMSVIFKRGMDTTMTESGKSGVALLVGAGDAIGSAVARRFATGGYCVCIARRDAEKSRTVAQEIVGSGGRARAVATDVRNEEAVQVLFAQVEAELGPVEVCLFNAGANVKAPLVETSGRLFFKAWELACYGGFLTGREAARYMVPRGRGTILFTGATASVRGGPGFASDVLTSVIYKEYQAGFYGLSTAGNVVLFILVTIIVYPLIRFFNSKELEL